jgi:preprotein translocase subunit SecE
MGAFFHELFQAGIYKRTQGRVTRQVTFAAVAIVVAMGCYRLMETLIDFGPAVSYAVPAAVLAVCVWVAYRLVNVPSFADFLIAVEAEMNKVSWPTRGELVRASIVVLVTIFVLAVVLFVFDFWWKWVFVGLGIVPG